QRSAYISVLVSSADDATISEYRGTINAKATPAGTVSSWDLVQNNGKPVDLLSSAAPDPNFPGPPCRLLSQGLDSIVVPLGIRRPAAARDLIGSQISAAATGLSIGTVWVAFVVDMKDGSIHEYYATDKGDGNLSYFHKYRGFLPGTFPASDPATVSFG